MFDRLDLHELFSGHNIRNRGIGFDNTHSLQTRLEDSVLSGAPEHIILYIGGNDLSKRKDIKNVIAASEKIIKIIVSKEIKLHYISLLSRGIDYSSPSKKYGHH